MGPLKPRKALMKIDDMKNNDYVAMNRVEGHEMKPAVSELTRELPF